MTMQKAQMENCTGKLMIKQRYAQLNFLSFWAPAKQIATNGSLCLQSVCPNIRLSCSAFSGNTYVPWNIGLVNSLQYNCTDTIIFSNVTVQQCTCTHVLVMYMYLKICMEAGKCHLKIPCHVYNQGKRLIHITCTFKQFCVACKA